MKRLELLDYGRFSATLAVMFFHYFFNGIQNGKISSFEHIPWVIDFAKYGYLGVEFFFMISGYVIFFSSKEKTAGEFGAARVLRLFPAFCGGCYIHNSCGPLLGW
ncbi:acyltransferase [Rhodoferax sp. 4810]|nr:acyltransferase [Rhodoferax jenense]